MVRYSLSPTFSRTDVKVSFYFTNSENEERKRKKTIALGFQFEWDNDQWVNKNGSWIEWSANDNFDVNFERTNYYC